MELLLFDQTHQETHLSSFPAPLGSTVKANGRTYNLVERSGNVAVYEGPISNDRPETRMFEVIVVRTAQAKTMPDGTELPFREVYPSSSDWGVYGWTFTNRSHRAPLQAARAKMASLLKRPARGGIGLAA